MKIGLAICLAMILLLVTLAYRTPLLKLASKSFREKIRDFLSKKKRKKKSGGKK